jgi:uncharacterized RDD family membrane protein YckC
VSEIEPGWYKDPAAPTTQRYWDGEGWIGDPLPADAVPPSGPPPTAPTEPPAAPTPPTPPAFPAVIMAPPTATTTQAPTPLGAPPGYRPPPQPHGYELAHPGQRLAARAIDLVAVLGLNAVVNGWFVWRWWRDFWPYYLEFARRYQAHQSVTDIPVPATQSLEIVIFVVGVALWFAYEVPALANTGQTLGKRLVGIRVLRLESDGPLGFGRAWRRWNPMGLATFLWTCFLIGFVLQFIDSLFVIVDHPLHQALHDKSAATVVVHVPRTGPTTAKDHA